MGKKIKLFAKKSFHKILTVLGITSVLTAIGCTPNGPDDDDDDGTLCYYGSPSNSYVLAGQITDSTGKGIEDIKVGVTPVKKYSYENKFAKTALTDEQGNYNLSWSDSNCRSKFVLAIEDIDGAENGLFENQSADITFEETDLKDNGTWVDYYSITGKNFTLNPKTSE